MITSRTLLFCLGIFAIALGLAGCDRQQTPTPPLTNDQIMNLEMESDFTARQTVTLLDGIYQAPVSPHSELLLSMRISGDPVFGDLNGDGAEDAAFVLLVHPGSGSTIYSYLVGATNVGGQAVYADSTLLGNRVQVTGLSIIGGNMAVLMKIHGEKDALCCPNLDLERFYRLSQAKLVELEHLIRATPTIEVIK